MQESYLKKWKGNNMFNRWLKRKTKKFTIIPLFNITFNYQKFLKDGAKYSCDVHYHPDFKDDDKLRQMLYNVIDYIRDNYDMEQFTKI